MPNPYTDTSLEQFDAATAKRAGVRPLGIQGGLPTSPKLPETTQLSPLEEALFQRWVANNKLQNVDAPDAHYDMRGFFQTHPDFKWTPGQHFPDTYKQHGHETFSQESQYSQGPWDGGMWVGPNGTTDPLTTFLAQPKLAVNHKH